MIHFTAQGDPQPQGSKHGWYNEKIKKVIMVESSFDQAKRHKNWRKIVASAAKVYAEENDHQILTEPVSIILDFVWPPTQRMAFWRDTAPDWDKLARSVCDSLTGVIYKDDALIVHGEVWKRREAGANPHVGIWVRPIASLHLEQELYRHV